MNHTPCIDLHAHLTPHDVVAYLERMGEATPDVAACTLVLPPAVSGFGPGAQMPYPPEQRDVALRAERNAAARIDLQVLSVPPYFFSYRESPERAREIAARANDALASAAASHPGRFAAFATVPLGTPADAVAELERAVDQLGMVGVEIGTNVAGTELEDRRLDEFWEYCEARGLPVFMHPHHQVGADRTQPYYLANLFGNPADTGLSVARLIFGGVLERYPNLSLILAHAGGVLPAIVGRLDHGYAVRPECRSAVPHPPSTYFAKLYFDTIAHDELALRTLVERVGAERVVIGTDAPFDMGIERPRDLIAELGLGPAETVSILHGNAEALIGPFLRADR